MVDRGCVVQGRKMFNRFANQTNFVFDNSITQIVHEAIGAR